MNFNAPYSSISITDFWRRWHISLSTWIRDYIYISFGGNRKGKVRQYVNLIITMLLGGLWHGASMNFVVWGGLHGVALAIHKYYRSEVLHHDAKYKSTGLKRLGAIFVTFNFVCFAWLFFRNTSFDASLLMLNRIFTSFHIELLPQIFEGYKYVFALMLFGYVTHFVPNKWQEGCISAIGKTNVVIQALLIVAVIYMVIQIKSSDIQPFIYFQF